MIDDTNYKIFFTRLKEIDEKFRKELTENSFLLTERTQYIDDIRDLER